MTKRNQIYKCSVCGNMVEVLHGGQGELTCCNQAMTLLGENTTEQGQEKHLPVAEKLSAQVCKEGDGLKVKVGEVAHPMDADHFIEWIEIITVDNKRGKKFLQPGDVPEAEFHTRAQIKEVRAYCNLHGLWKTAL